MSPCIIGIDTGGTCTDAVCLDTATGHVLATTKVPTTHHRLSDGIISALSSLWQHPIVSQQQVATVALSTTLATNSVIENTGARVALFVIGYVKHFKLPITALVYLKGGHKIDGSEEEPLELEYLVNSLAHLKNEVDAYAVCSALSVINPTHELVVEKAISMIDPKPVFCSHRASGRTGMKERAATAALHATLMPLMEEFIDSVKSAMASLNLPCPLSIITGSGTAVTPDQATTRSGLTVASGPACTALFGAQHGAANCLVVDIGGTTTDIVLIENGTPSLATDGCVVGSWTTHMKSVDMFTGGIGGDSLVKRTGESYAVGPDRVVPLCRTGTLPTDPENWSGFEKDGRLVSLHPQAAIDSSNDHPVCAALQRRGPSTLQLLSEDTGLSIPVLDNILDDLARHRMLTISGFTPTDALHLLGLASFGTANQASVAADKLANLTGLASSDFCKLVVKLTEKRIIEQILSYLSRHCWGNTLPPTLVEQSGSSLLDVSFRVKLPIIGLGAAAHFFLPGVAEQLGTTVSFPDHHEVGNAIGATLSVVSSQKSTEVPPP